MLPKIGECKATENYSHVEHGVCMVQRVGFQILSLLTSVRVVYLNYGKIPEFMCPRYQKLTNRCDDYRIAQFLCVSDTDSQTRDDYFFNHEYQQQPEHRVCIVQRVTFQMLPLRCVQTLCVTISHSQNQQSQRDLRPDNLLNINADFGFVQRYRMTINFPPFRGIITHLKDDNHIAALQRDYFTGYMK